MLWTSQQPDWYKERHCKYYEKDGHTEEFCRRKKYDESGSSEKKSEEEKQKGAGAIGLCALNLDEFAASCNCDKEVLRKAWIVDSGASHHMSNSIEGFINKRSCDETVSMGDGAPVKAQPVHGRYQRSSD